MIDRFSIIKFWSKELRIFDILNRNVAYNRIIKNSNKNCRLVTQTELTRSNRVDYLNLLFERFGNSPIDFLEFGVFRGESILGVAKINENQENRFYGFDTFEGYPEGFDNHPKGAYTTNGTPPPTNDSRVQFIKGKFQKSLPLFLKTYSPNKYRIIHLDADLYSSTLYVLTKLDDLIDENTILTFDEFGDLRNEFPAFYDYVRSYYREFEIIQHTQKFNRVSLTVKHG